MATKPKMMPHSLEAEQAVLGCLLIDGETAFQIFPVLKGEDFYIDSHSHIYECMRNIYNSNRPIDFVTLTDELENTSSLDTVGGMEYITTLTNIVPTAANFSHYTDIVKRNSILRQLIHSSQKIIENSYNTDDKDEAISFAEKQIFDIAQKEETSNLEQLANSLNEVIEKFDLIAKNKGALRGLPTGFEDFDKITNGLQNSDLILLAARPGVGKTSFAMQIVNNVAMQGKKCAVFSLEMPKVQIAQRSICSVAMVSMEKALKGNLDMEDWKSIWAANKKLSEAGIFVDDSSMNTPVDILSKCRRLKREQGLDLIMIDYLQLMSSGSKKNTDNRQQEISEMTRYLKIAARELNVPIIVLSQLSRAVETRKDHRPVLSDLRESGAIEQDADIVLFIYKADMYNDVVNEDEPGVCELIVAKHRNGSQGTVKLRWVGEYVSFMDYNKKPIKKSENGTSVATPTFDPNELERAYTPPSNDEE